jgi:hypothetical protein
MNRVENGSEHFLIHKLIKKEWVFWRPVSIVKCK